MTDTNYVSNSGNAYRAGIALAVLTSFLIVWTSIVRDDGHAAGGFMIILACGVGWFAAWFRAGGMARTMAGLSIMQVLLGILTATAPIVTQLPGGSINAMIFNGAFAALWLISAACFHIAAKRPA